MLTGYQLAYMARENTSCYKAGLDSASGLDVTPIPCAPNGTLISVDWGIPCSNNGVAVTGFDWQKATSSTKPRADAIKVITVQNNLNGGVYGRWIVPDNYVDSDFVSACCAGCDPLPAVTIPAPLLGYAECTYAPPAARTCIYQGSLFVASLTGSNTTFTATPTGADASGTPIVFSPSTATGTSIALLAAAMQTAWASELGTGTFTAVGNTITYTSTNGATIGFSIAQS